MPLPANLTHRQLLGIWHRRKRIQKQNIDAWLLAVGEVLTRARSEIGV